MRHHIIFKFLAVFLCAASLLGAVGSGLGLFAVTELGLRDKTPEEAYADSQYYTVESLANELAVRYASWKLGGADESLAAQYYGNHWLQSTFDWSQIDFVIKDEGGNALHTYSSGSAVESAFYEITTGGSRYIRVLNKMTQDEYEEKYNLVTEPPMTMAPEVDVDHHVYNAVPEDGWDIGMIRADYADGSQGEYGSTATEPIGRVMWFMDQQLRLDFYHYEHSNAARNLISDIQNGYSVVGIVLVDPHGNVVLDASDPAGLLEEFCTDPAYFVLRPLEETPLEMGSVYDAIPPEGQSVNVCYVKYADGYEESVGGAPDIGFLSYDEEGFVVFTANDPGLMDLRSQRLVHICFSDEMGNQIYEATDTHGVGRFALENDTLIFTSRESAGMEPTAPEPGQEVYVYDDVPPRGYAVYEMDLWLEGSTEMLTITGTDDRLGMATHDDSGNVVFTAEDWKDFVFSKPAQVRYILMSGQDGRILYEAYQAGVSVGKGDPIGYFAYNEAGDLVFGRITDRVALASVMEDMETEPVQIQEEETVPETIEVPAPTDESATVDPTEESAETTEITETEVTEPAMAEGTIPATEPTYALDTIDETAPATVPADMDSTYVRAVEEDGLRVFGYYDSTIGEEVVVEYTYEPTPAYTVEIRMGPGALEDQFEWVLMELLYDVQRYLIPMLVVSLLVFAITAVYLCCAAGKRPGSTEIRANGLNCIPIDLYLAAVVGGIICCVIGIVEGGGYLIERDIQTGMLFVALCAYGACLLFVGFCFAFAAQVKTPDGYFLRNSVCGRSLKVLAWLWKRFVRFCGWLWKFIDEKLEPLMVRIAKALWKLTKFFWQQLKRALIWSCGKIRRGCDWLSRILGRFLSMLPLTWQFLLIGFTLVIFLYIMIRTYKVGYLLIGFGVFFGVIL